MESGNYQNQIEVPVDETNPESFSSKPGTSVDTHSSESETQSNSNQTGWTTNSIELEY